MPAYPPAKPIDPECKSAVESIGHIKQKVTALWPSAELDVFISHLIMDSRDGERQGLPVNVADELLFLATLNKIRRAIEKCEALGLKYADAYRMIDSGDQARLEADGFDDPLVSRDTVSRSVGNTNKASAPSGRRVSAAAAKADENSGIFGLLTSRYMVIFIIVALAFKLAWPTLRPMLMK